MILCNGDLKVEWIMLPLLMICIFILFSSFSSHSELYLIFIGKNKSNTKVLDLLLLFTGKDMSKNVKKYRLCFWNDPEGTIDTCMCIINICIFDYGIRAECWVKLNVV